MVVVEQTTETFAAIDVTGGLADFTTRADQFVAESLMNDMTRFLSNSERSDDNGRNCHSPNFKKPSRSIDLSNG